MADFKVSFAASMFLLALGLAFLWAAVAQGAPDWLPFTAVGVYLIWRATQ